MPEMRLSDVYKRQAKGRKPNIITSLELKPEAMEINNLRFQAKYQMCIRDSLKAGIPVCPPEGDAGTGMVATNAVKQRTGNVSAGTSSFSIGRVDETIW